MFLPELNMRESGNINGRPRARGAKAPNAALVDPVDLLAAEDEEALRRVDRFEAAASVILQRGFSAEAFAEICTELEYIHTALRLHSARETRYLIPMLLQHTEAPRETDQWSWHEIWEEVDELRERVEDLEDGYIHARLVREMAEGCKRVALMIREQILRERQDVLPVVRVVLTPREYRQLQKKFMQLDAPQTSL